jgi:RNA-binding protein YlmH
MSIYQHFRSEEHTFIDQVLEWKETVNTQYAPKLTDFLDPREQYIVHSVIGNKDDISVAFFGGSPFVERKRALVYPPYFSPEKEDFQLSLFEIVYPQKFVSLEHRQVLGSLMSLGLKRSKFGDILIKDERIQIVVSKEISEYVRLHLQAIGKTNITLKETDLTNILLIEEQWLEQSTTVSSMRLDVIISAVYNLSRQKVQPLITNNLVKVNWKIIDQPSFECKEGDTISVRGYGRCKILLVEGKTKKEKWRIVVGKQK